MWSCSLVPFRLRNQAGLQISRERVIRIALEHDRQEFFRRRLLAKTKLRLRLQKQRSGRLMILQIVVEQ